MPHKQWPDCWLLWQTWMARRAREVAARVHHEWDGPLTPSTISCNAAHTEGFPAGLMRRGRPSRRRARRPSRNAI
jgi:hypothetical protein